MSKNFKERREEIHLYKCIFGEDCRKEFAEIDKHEVIAKICDCLGTAPENFNSAESIFENLRYEIAKYVIHHEFSMQNGIRPDLLLWLDTKTNPANEKKLKNFIRKYV